VQTCALPIWNRFGAMASTSCISIIANWRPTQSGAPPRGTLTASSADTLVRVNEVLLAGRLFAVHRDLSRLKRFGQRDLLRVSAREGRLDLSRDTFAQLLCRLGSNLLKERRQEPAADTPRHAEGAIELRRSTIEPSVDVDLLVGRRPIAAVFLGGLVGRDLHAREYLTRLPAAADRVEGEGRPRFDEGVRQVVHDRRRAHVADVGRA